MEKKKTKFTRKEIYDLIWEKPFTTIAKEYNISDNSLRKICKKYKITYPKAGHWMKVKHGVKIKKGQYKEIEEWKDKVFDFEERGSFENSGQYKYKCLLDEIKDNNAEYLNVPEKLTKPDILIKNYKSFYSKKDQDYQYQSTNIININVYKENEKRAILIFDTIIKLLKKNNHKIMIRNFKTYVVIDEIEILISLRELNKRVKDTDSKYSHYNTTKLVTTGKLLFSIGYFHCKIVKDGRLKLEERIADIYATIISMYQDKKEQNEWYRIQREENERKQQIELKKKAKIEEEHKRVEMLYQDSSAWNKSNSMRKMIDYFENKVSKDVKTQKANEWLEWAKSRALELDPFQNGIESFVSRYDIAIDVNSMTNNY